MREDPETTLNRDELQRQLRILKIRVAGQDDEIQHLRDEIQRISEQVRKLPAEDCADTTRPVPKTTKTTGPVPRPSTPLPPTSESGEDARGPDSQVSEGDPPKIPLVIPPPSPRVEKAGVFAAGGDSRSLSKPEPLTDLSSSAVAERRAELETRIGVYWFNRIGLVLLMIGFALFSRHIHSLLQPWHKIGILYLGSGALFCIGKIWEEKLQQFARPVMAAGLALAFLTSYAAHFVPPTACFALLPALVAMLVSVVAMLFCAERWRSETTAGLAILLGHVAVLVAGRDAGSFTTIAILSLGIAAVALGLRHQWMRLTLCAVLAAFASHTVWALIPTGRHASLLGEFWIHFLSVTAYYALFTLAALAFQYGRSSENPDAFPRSQIAAGRSVGPCALIFYVSFAAWLFRSTAIFQDSIQWFLFPLAVVQLSLAHLHRRFRSVDAHIYLAAAVVFATLALFAWLDGLTLNLSLAAEALLLLILGRSLDLWLLNPLAQVVLAINFVHFWGSDAHVIHTWPAFLGAVVSASVYFVKSRLEEAWCPHESGRRSEGLFPAWIEPFRRLTYQWVHPLSHLHAFAGGILLAYQCCTFFAPIGELISLAGLIVLLAALIAILRSVPWFWGFLVLHAALILRIFQADSIPATSDLYAARLWITCQGAVLFVLITDLSLIMLSRRRQELLLYLTGLTGLVLSPTMVFFAAGVGNALIPPAYGCLIAPLAYLFIAEGLPKLWERPGRLNQDSGDGGMVGMAEELKNLPIHGFFAVAGGALTHIVALACLPGPVSVRWLLLIIGLMGLATALFRNSPALTAGVAVLLTLNTAHLFAGGSGTLVAELSPFLIWATVFTTVLAGGLFAIRGIGRRRSSLLAAGLIHLIVGMGAVLVLLFSRTFTFTPTWLWILTSAGFWVVIEVYHRGLRTGIEPDASWRDRILLSILASQRNRAAMTLSIVGALVVSGILHQSLATSTVFWRAELVVAMVFSVGTAILRSPSLAVSAATALMVAQGGYLLSGDRLLHPFWTILLLVVSLAAGATSERLSRRGPVPWSDRIRRVLGAGGRFGALSTMGMGAYFLHGWAGEQFSSPSLAVACQLLIALPVAIVGARFALPTMATSTSILVFWVMLVSLAFGFADSTFRSLLHHAAILIAVQTIALERLLTRLPDQDPEGSSSVLRLRQTFVVASAVLLLAAFHWAVEVRDAWTTLGWSITALTYLGLGFLLRFSTYRRVALVIFLASIARIIAIDMAGLASLYRIVAFLALGACLIGASFLYSRFRDEIQKWL